MAIRQTNRGGEMPVGQTHGHLFRGVRDRFRRHGLENCELDARLLVTHAAGADGQAFALIADDSVDEQTARLVDRLAERRLSGEPLARILRHKEFWSLDFALNAATFVPRPETEILVGAALARFADRLTAQLRILDLGTGSGAVLVALLSELPNAFAVGVDIDARAIRQARANASRHGVVNRCGWLVGDFGAAIGTGFDLIVSNPPYVPTCDIAGLDVAVRAHDPHLALDGGADGLSAYRAICDSLLGMVAPGGYVLFEVGVGQADTVRSLLGAKGFEVLSIERDLSGINRVVTGQWSFAVD